MSERDGNTDCTVRHFRQILVWPLQLMPLDPAEPLRNHWDVLLDESPSNPWDEVQDEFASPADFQERHYNEFVAFLPYVQRMLYGEGKGCGNVPGESPMRVFRRGDIAKLRVVFPDDETHPLELDVAHIDLYFFYDMDVAILVTEVSASDISFARAHEVLFRLGRSYPTYWTKEGRGGHCFSSAQWLNQSGEVLAASDYDRRDKYLTFACRHRAPCISSHWEYVLRPLVLHHSDQRGPIRYRLVEYHRMPVCGFFTFDDPQKLSRSDFMRLALVAPPGKSDVLPVPERMAWDFEARYCYDRFWDQRETGLSSTRSMCSGEAFIMVGSAHEGAYPGGGPSLRELFRHQYFLVFLIAHLQKAALLMLSDRLLHALNRLVPGDAETVRRFKREIRALKEIFLRFTHRYWHHELSDQLMAKALYRMCQEHLSTERLFAEVGGEIEKMDDYLDSDSIRRQANMVVRLTVVTIFSLIGTVATSFLGMNLFAWSEKSGLERLLLFLLVLLPTTVLTFYTIIKSKRLADFLDALSDERMPLKAKAGALLDVWRKPRSLDPEGISHGP